ncbi:IS30 family transposase [Corynebacterium diphtheriae]|uniref:IS30 family transposase n=1 Tax=Corynebacterium diphtheriae TaxID=1717 RepID=UPI0009D77C7C|nr:IS30 family transposase [Corynebacterium diphtheriae]
MPVGVRRQWRADRALRPAMRSPGRPVPSRAVQRQFWGLIAILWEKQTGVREIARRIGRNPATISRELRRNAATRGDKQIYRAGVAQWKAQEAAKRPKQAKLVDNPRLQDYVQERLAGTVRDENGVVMAGPDTPAWKGRSKPHRADRRWLTAWSPEQISQRLRIDFPDNESMRISHEAIYQALYIEGRGALKRELVAALRTGRALRKPRARSKSKLVHLPRLDGWGEQPRTKNGPALGGYGAEAMNTALQTVMKDLPLQLRQTLTWDRGTELADHAAFTLATGTKVFFADPHSPWQRPTNENSNGLLRQYFPKGTDLSRWTAQDLAAIAYTLNNRPRKVLGFRTPAEVFNEQLQSIQNNSVATTD